MCVAWSVLYVVHTGTRAHTAVPSEALSAFPAGFPGCAVGRSGRRFLLQVSFFCWWRCIAAGVARHRAAARAARSEADDGALGTRNAKWRHERLKEQARPPQQRAIPVQGRIHLGWRGVLASGRAGAARGPAAAGTEALEAVRQELRGHLGEQDAASRPWLPRGARRLARQRKGKEVSLAVGRP